MQIKFKKLIDGVNLPKYQSKYSSGMDIESINDVEIYPNSSEIISTGLSVEIPTGYEIQVRSRSGLAAKFSLHVLNSPGTIDSDYRGEIKIILHNSGNLLYKINKGDRIAQLVVQKIEQFDIIDVDNLSNTIRGNNGFGSTGR